MEMASIWLATTRIRKTTLEEAILSEMKGARSLLRKLQNGALLRKLQNGHFSEYCKMHKVNWTKHQIDANRLVKHRNFALA